MKIGIISDTHNSTKHLDEIFSKFKNKDVEYVVHCGDWVNVKVVKDISNKAKEHGLKIKGVPGNNDFELHYKIKSSKEPVFGIELPETEVLELEEDGRDIAVYHGQNESILSYLIESEDYDAVFTGHTHQAKVEQENQTLVVNPGSAKYKSRINGEECPTYAIYKTKDNSANIYPVNT